LVQMLQALFFLYGVLSYIVVGYHLIKLDHAFASFS